MKKSQILYKRSFGIYRPTIGKDNHEFMNAITHPNFTYMEIDKDVTKPIWEGAVTIIVWGEFEMTEEEIKNNINSKLERSLTKEERDWLKSRNNYDN